jgi:hypothetical protein
MYPAEQQYRELVWQQLRWGWWLSRDGDFTAQREVNPSLFIITPIFFPPPYFEAKSITMFLLSERRWISGQIIQSLSVLSLTRKQGHLFSPKYRFFVYYDVEGSSSICWKSVRWCAVRRDAVTDPAVFYRHVLIRLLVCVMTLDSRLSRWTACNEISRSPTTYYDEFRS